MQPPGRRGSKVAAAVARLHERARAFDGGGELGHDFAEPPGGPQLRDGADRVRPSRPWSPVRREVGARVAPMPPVTTPRKAATPPASPRLGLPARRRAFSALVAGFSIALAGGALYTTTRTTRGGRALPTPPTAAPTTLAPTTTTAPPTTSPLPTAAPTLKPTIARWLRGVVCDEGGRPVANASVALHYGSFAFEAKLFEVFTDAAGLFAFELVLPGVYYTLVARFDGRENFRLTKTPVAADVVIPLPPANKDGLVALLSWGIAGDDGRVPPLLNLAAVVAGCAATTAAGSCPGVTVEASKAAAFATHSSALDAASHLQRHGFAALRVEGDVSLTLAVETPLDSTGALESTATLIVDVFVEGAHTHQFWRPPNCAATTVGAGKNCSAYANASFVETAATYAWQGAANRPRSRLLRVACRVGITSASTPSSRRRLELRFDFHTGRVRLPVVGRHRRRPAHDLRRHPGAAVPGPARGPRGRARGGVRVRGLRLPVPRLARDALGGGTAPPARPPLARHEPRRLPVGRRRGVRDVARAARLGRRRVGAHARRVYVVCCSWLSFLPVA